VTASKIECRCAVLQWATATKDASEKILNLHTWPDNMCTHSASSSYCKTYCMHWSLNLIMFALKSQLIQTLTR